MKTKLLFAIGIFGLAAVAVPKAQAGVSLHIGLPLPSVVVRAPLPPLFPPPFVVGPRVEVCPPPACLPAPYYPDCGPVYYGRPGYSYRYDRHYDYDRHDRGHDWDRGHDHHSWGHH